MLLDDLMELVFNEANVTLSQVQDAIREHMFHDGDPGGAIRFSLNSSDHGITVKVMPKRGGGTGYMPQTGPSGGRWDTSRGGRSCRAGSNVPKMRGSVAQAPKPPPKDDWQPPPKKGASPKNLVEKLDMSLGDLIRDEQRPRQEQRPQPREIDPVPVMDASARHAARMRHVRPTMELPPWHKNLNGVPEAARPARRANRMIPQPGSLASNSAVANPAHARVRRSMEQMGWTPASQHIRQGPQNWARDGESKWGERRGQRGGWRNSDGRDRYTPQEKVQRWMAYVLRKGHQDLGVEVKDGWASLRDIAAQITVNKHLGFGECDEAKLAKFIQDTDCDGRFEIKGSHIRKVSKEQRAKTNGTAINGGGSAAGAARAGPSFHRSASISSDEEDSWRHDARQLTGANHRSRSRSASSNGLDRMDQDMDALVERANMMRMAGEVEVIDAADADAVRTKLERADSPPRPEPPVPGGENLYWKQFQDDGFMWWFYDGPCGKWWVNDEVGAQPELYEEDD